ncbi:MAG: hypothetical protein Q9169_007192, partial [Polycauliona sp. 2 TL-2023]
MAKFAIGSIAEMAARNTPLQVPASRVPHLGSHLQVHWIHVAALFSGIITMHL